MTTWFSENWICLLAVIVAILILVYGLMTGKVREWLKFAVAIAEKELGSGTGQLKLHQVYDMFIQQWPVFSKLVPFSVFSSWVDLALEWLKDQLEKNERINEVVTGTYNF